MLQKDVWCTKAALVYISPHSLCCKRGTVSLACPWKILYGHPTEKYKALTTQHFSVCLCLCARTSVCYRATGALVSWLFLISLAELISCEQYPPSPHTHTHTYRMLLATLCKHVRVYKLACVVSQGGNCPSSTRPSNKRETRPLQKNHWAVSRLSEQYTQTTHTHTHTQDAMCMSSHCRLSVCVRVCLSDSVPLDRSHFLSFGACLNLSCFPKAFTSF